MLKKPDFSLFSIKQLIDGAITKGVAQKKSEEQAEKVSDDKAAGLLAQLEKTAEVLVAGLEALRERPGSQFYFSIQPQGNCLYIGTNVKYESDVKHSKYELDATIIVDSDGMKLHMGETHSIQGKQDKVVRTILERIAKEAARQGIVS